MFSTREFPIAVRHLELSMIFRAKKIKQKGWQEKKKQLLKRTGKSNMNLRKSKKKVSRNTTRHGL